MSTGPGLPTPGHATYDELTVGFALDALEPGEEALLLAHLPDCLRCQDALIAHREVAASLAYALPSEPLEPLSAALAECAASTPRQLPLDPFAAAEAAQRRPGGLIIRQRRQRPVTDSSPAGYVSRYARRILVGAGALGIVAAVGLSGYDVHLRSTPTRSSGATAALQAITERGATIAHLSGTGAGSSGTAVVANGHAYLVASGLPSTGGSSSYVVWNLDTTRPTALQRFAFADRTSPQVVDLGVAHNTTPKKYAVTLEPASVKASLPSTPSNAYVLTQDGYPA